MGFLFAVSINFGGYLFSLKLQIENELVSLDSIELDHLELRRTTVPNCVLYN